MYVHCFVFKNPQYKKVLKKANISGKVRSTLFPLSIYLLAYFSYTHLQRKKK